MHAHIEGLSDRAQKGYKVSRHESLSTSAAVQMSHIWNTELVSADWNLLDLEQMTEVYPGPQQLQGPSSASGSQFIDSDNFNEESGFSEMLVEPFSSARESPIFEIPSGFEEPIPHFMTTEQFDISICELEPSPHIATGPLTGQPVKKRSVSSF